MDKMNARLEPECRLEWEIETGVRRLNVRRNVGGPKPKWKFTEETGKLERHYVEVSTSTAIIRRSLIKSSFHLLRGVS
jgi:hypothetical protein